MKPSRRQFLRQTGASAAAAMLAPHVAHAKQERKIHVGVVGGGFGSTFFWHLHPKSVGRRRQRPLAGAAGEAHLDRHARRPRVAPAIECTSRLR